MIEDRKLTRTVTLHCNNGEYKTVEQVADVQLRWNSETPEVDQNRLGFVNATPWQLVATDPRQIEYERAADFATAQQLAAVREERGRLREACEWVHATANGNTYGLTVADQLEALRLAAAMCSEALSPAQEPKT